jgi:hypothetical protein
MMRRDGSGMCSRIRARSDAPHPDGWAQPGYVEMGFGWKRMLKARILK